MRWLLCAIVGCSGSGPTNADRHGNGDTDTGDPWSTAELACADAAEIGFEAPTIEYGSSFYQWGYGTYGAEGWTGEVFDTRAEWEAFAQQMGFSDPIPDVDFDANDVTLYQLDTYCSRDVVFLGACSDGVTRVVHSTCGPPLGSYCDVSYTNYRVLVIAEDGDAGLDVVYSCP